jgi:hypothetical protein
MEKGLVLYAKFSAMLELAKLAYKNSEIDLVNNPKPKPVNHWLSSKKSDLYYEQLIEWEDAKTRLDFTLNYLKFLLFAEQNSLMYNHPNSEIEISYELFTFLKSQADLYKE